jgi:hypothetical protein
MDDEPSFGMERDLPPGPINWNLLDAPTAAIEWRDLDAFVTWLKNTFGLAPAIVPPYWHRHDELIWELSALHTHFLACYSETASPSAPVVWMREFADCRQRLREWVAICGTRLDRDRPTRQTTACGSSGKRRDAVRQHQIGSVISPGQTGSNQWPHVIGRLTSSPWFSFIPSGSE